MENRFTYLIILLNGYLQPIFETYEI